jgi:hypothetical protein
LLAAVSWHAAWRNTPALADMWAAGAAQVPRWKSCLRGVTGTANSVVRFTVSHRSCAYGRRCHSYLSQQGTVLLIPGAICLNVVCEACRVMPAYRKAADSVQARFRQVTHACRVSLSSDGGSAADRDGPIHVVPSKLSCLHMAECTCTVHRWPVVNHMPQAVPFSVHATWSHTTLCSSHDYDSHDSWHTTLKYNTRTDMQKNGQARK